MTPHERYVRALRDAASAYEEAHCGKTRKRRHRGPVKFDHAPASDALARTVVGNLARAGVARIR